VFDYVLRGSMVKRSAAAALAVAATSLAAWTTLALGRGKFWEAKVDALRDALDIALPRDTFSGARIEAIVPARNEAETIGRAISSLISQTYSGPFTITLVDDQSDDDTANVARAAIATSPHAERLSIVRGRALEAGWTGKLSALNAGIAHVLATREKPDYWLFTDADIEHHATNVEELVAKAQGDDRDLVSLMVRLRCESGWERLLVPAFVYFFAKLYPFAWSNDRARKTAAAAGGCILLRASALDAIGGLDAISDRLIDDCALAGAVKAQGGSLWLEMSTRTQSIREYGTLESFWHMVKRSAFTQLDHSYLATAGATLGMALLYLAPPVLTIVGTVRRDAKLGIVAGSAWLVLCTLYRPTLRAYGRPSAEAIALPIAASLYMAMTIDSALAHARGRGGVWKGRPSPETTRVTSREPM
jgi:hopene-associated glycosyltransferase HpnB